MIQANCCVPSSIDDLFFIFFIVKKTPAIHSTNLGSSSHAFLFLWYKMTHDEILRYTANRQNESDGPKYLCTEHHIARWFHRELIG